VESRVVPICRMTIDIILGSDMGAGRASEAQCMAAHALFASFRV